MPKPIIIEHWERGFMFGAAVIRGWVDGELRIARFSAAIAMGCWVEAAEGNTFWRFGRPAPGSRDAPLRQAMEEVAQLLEEDRK